MELVTECCCPRQSPPVSTCVLRFDWVAETWEYQFDNIRSIIFSRKRRKMAAKRHKMVGPLKREGHWIVQARRAVPLRKADAAGAIESWSSPTDAFVRMRLQLAQLRYPENAIAFPNIYVAAVTAFPSRNATRPLSSFPTQYLSQTGRTGGGTDFPPATRHSDRGREKVESDLHHLL